jgi:hypothetical protein
MRRRENGKSFDDTPTRLSFRAKDLLFNQIVIPSKARNLLSVCTHENPESLRQRTRSVLIGRFSLFFSTLLLNIDSELLGFLVEMAALQAKRLSSIRNVVIASFQLGENCFTLEVLYPLSQRT